MKRTALLAFWLMLGFVGLGTSKAQTQSTYVGLAVSYATLSGLEPDIPLPALHIGGPLTDTLEVRGTLESLLVISNLGVDFLYPFSRSPTSRLYAGVGVNTSFYFYFPSGSDVRVTFGGTYFVNEEPYLETAGLFGEVRTYVRSFSLLSAGHWPTLEGCLGITFPL